MVYLVSNEDDVGLLLKDGHTNANPRHPHFIPPLMR